jgi:hypothetical protein
VPSAVIRGPMNLKTFGATDVSKCHIMSRCITYISFPNLHIFAFFAFLPGATKLPPESNLLDNKSTFSLKLVQVEG